MLGDKDLSIPAKMMDFYALRHKIIAHNLANANVPGFHKMNVSFEKELLEAIKSRDPERIRSVALKVEEAKGAGVDPESEVAGMAKNQILFDTFAQIAQYRLRMLRSAIGPQ